MGAKLMTSKIKLSEFMLLGSSLKKLNKVGSGSREIRYYELLSSSLDITLFTYDQEEYVTDCFMTKCLSPIRCNKYIKSLIGPFLAPKNGHSKRSVVRCKQIWGSWAALIYARLTKSTYIVRIGYVWTYSVKAEHSDKLLYKIIKNVLNIFENILVRFGDAYIFASPDIEKRFKPFIKNKPSKIIENGFDISIFYDDLNEKKYDFIYVGRFIKTKKIDKIASILNSGHSIAIGNGPYHGDFLPHVKIYDKMLNHELPKYYRTAKCYVSLSKTEGSPKSVIEAILCGCYPILSNIPAHNYIINQLGYGLLLNELDECDADEILKGNIKIDYKKLKNFKKHYDMHHIVHKEVEFIKEIIS
jgi:glycosyltransferase involved in cell wall biosynthesis